MRRGLGLALAAGLLIGGAAGCGDDDDGGDGGGAQESTTTAADGAADDGAAEGAEGGETPEDEVVAANDAIIQEYCDASIANDEALQASLDDPESEAARDALAETSGRLGEASDAVAPVVETFTPEQQAQFEACQS